MCRMLVQSIAIVIGALSLAFGIWQYRRTRVPRLRLTCAIGVFRASFETGGNLEQPIIEVKALNVGHVPVTLDRLSARSNGRDVILRDCWLFVNESNEFPYRLDLGESWVGTLDYFGIEEKISRVFGPHSTQRLTMRLWDATDRPYETELDLADDNIPPLKHYPSVDTARAVAAAFRRHHEERQTAPLMRFVPDGAPSGSQKRKKRKRK